MTRTRLAAAIVLSAWRVMAQTPVTLQAVAPVDAHAHVYSWSAPLQAMLRRMNLRVVSVAALDPYDNPVYRTLAPQHRMLREMASRSGERAIWISSFDPAGFEQPDFARRVIVELNETFRQGASGVKLYKTIGMEMRRRDGIYVMPDDAVFSPILDAIAAAGKPLYVHAAEPAGAWSQPLDPDDPDYKYYRSVPQWHISARPDRPSKAAILAARDRMLAAHTNLKVVGCHLGSMEEDVDEIAKRLDRYPNFVVDTAARVRHLARQPRDKVRAFCIKYQDRILYATDTEIVDGPDMAANIERWRKQLEADWKYFATAEPVPGSRGGRGLELPEPVLRKLFHDNAAKTIPAWH